MAHDIGGIKTFDNVVDRLLSICRFHPMVHQAETGDAWEISHGGNVVYPLCMVVPTGINALEKEVRYNFNLICMDLVEPGENNEKRVLSQTSDILLDIVAYYRRGGSAFLTAPGMPNYKDTATHYRYTNDADIVFNLEPFTEKFDDNVAGWNMQFSVTMVHDYSVCSWDGSFINISDIDNTTHYATGSSGAQGQGYDE